MAAVLLVLFGGMWLTKPAVTIDETGWRVAFGAASPAVAAAGLTPGQAAQVRQVVFEALAEHEQQQRTMLAKMASEQQPAPAVSAAEVMQIKRDIQEFRQDYSDSYALMRNSIEGLSKTVNGEYAFASFGQR
jgi:hypothetical protein